MKKYLGMICFLLTLISTLGFSGALISAEKNGNRIIVLFTNDLHDHFEAFNINHNGTVNEFGGYVSPI